MYNKTIILDFDGTILRLFANYDLDSVVKKIAHHLTKYALDFSLESDIFDAYEFVNQLDIEKKTKIKILSEVNEIIVKAEIDALKTGIMVEGFHDFINYVTKNNIPFGIVTNNSEECIEKFIDSNGKIFRCSVVGRDAIHPERMKPSDYMLKKISKIMNINKSNMLFIGDNLRDYQCAKEYGCEFIGLTPTCKKRERMIKAAKDIVIVDDFHQLIENISVNNE